MRRSGLVVLVAAFLLSLPVLAQKPADNVWRKTVIREIDMRNADEKEHHLVPVGTDEPLASMLADDVIKGKARGYANTDEPFATLLTHSEVMHQLSPRTDTMVVPDPVTHKDNMVVVHHDIDFNAIQKFRIMEEWSFNSATGKTDIQIIGIAPVQDVVVDGQFRGKKALFVVKYAEALPALNRYDQKHPEKTFAQYIWDDYFLSDTKPSPLK